MKFCAWRRLGLYLNFHGHKFLSKRRVLHYISMDARRWEMDTTNGNDTPSRARSARARAGVPLPTDVGEKDVGVE
jgi:hypothetical protein